MEFLELALHIWYWDNLVDVFWEKQKVSWKNVGKKCPKKISTSFFSTVEKIFGRRKFLINFFDRNLPYRWLAFVFAPANKKIQYMCIPIMIPWMPLAKIGSFFICLMLEKQMPEDPILANGIQGIIIGIVHSRNHNITNLNLAHNCES